METYEVRESGEIAEKPEHRDEAFPRRVDGRENARKSLGSDKISSIAAGAIANGSINAALLNYTVVTVTVSAGNSSGSSTVVSGGIIAGYYPSTNQDQIVKSIIVSGTTLTVNLLANATANNVFKVFVFSP